MLSTPFYFSLSLGVGLFFLGLFLLLFCLSVRRGKDRPAWSQSKLKIKLVSTQQRLNARANHRDSCLPTHCHVGNSFAGPNSSFNLETCRRVKSMIGEKKDPKLIAQQEKLSLGEVRLIASLGE